MTEERTRRITTPKVSNAFLVQTEIIGDMKRWRKGRTVQTIEEDEARHHDEVSVVMAQTNGREGMDIEIEMR